MSISLWPHGLWPARLLCPWNFSGKNAAVGYHSLLQRIFPAQGSNPGLQHYRWILYCLNHAIKKIYGGGLVAKSCRTLCNPMDCSLPGSSVHGIFQTRILEWVAISFSRGSSPPRDNLGLLHCRWILYQLSYQGCSIFKSGDTQSYLWSVCSYLLHHSLLSNFCLFFFSCKLSSLRSTETEKD